ncbi:MAG TPA: hypothetical protein ENI83_02305 [Gammaproteobacteria bacterium]|nr:hypothetical protein [Gammaproteobacteria bacterium]
MFVSRLYVLIPLVLLWLAGCGSSPVEPVRPPVDQGIGIGIDGKVRSYVEQGDFLTAAQQYLDAARTARPELRPALRLKAAALLEQGELWDQLRPVLANIDTRALSEPLRIQHLLLSARLDLAEGRSKEALQKLQPVRNPELLPDHGYRYYQLRAMAYAMRGNALEAARQLIWLDGLVDDPQQKLENQYQIWKQLSTLTTRALEELRVNPPPDPLSGWMELLQITRQSHGDRQEWMRQLANWRSRYPGHAAENALLPDLLGQVQQLTARPKHIAVLLPFTGRASESAAALRDGMLAAWYEEQPVDTTLRFYDTGGDAMLLWSVYQTAVEDGADFVIGPLLKDAIGQLAQSGLLPVPVMALNQIGGETDRELPLYQFGLAPEDEARQAAQRIFNDGHQYVISLIPNNPWGERVFTAFASTFGDLGGEVLETGRYPPATADFKKPIEQTLNLDDSKRRRNALQRLLGEKLHYEPRRRKDVEAVFILGFPQQARQLRPQLRFHHAGDLPVYSTSHVFSATSDPGLDRDMDGLMFCDIPWVLDKRGRWAEKRQMLARIWPVRSKRFQRLFALGYDAWLGTPWLGTLNMPGFSNYPGATGILTLDDQKRLHRTLEWARFRRGVPQLIHNDKPVSTEGRHESQSDRRPGRDPGL